MKVISSRWILSLIIGIFLCHTAIWIIAVLWRSYPSYQTCPSTSWKRLVYIRHKNYIKTSHALSAGRAGSPRGLCTAAAQTQGIWPPPTALLESGLHSAEVTNRCCRSTCSRNAASLPTPASSPQHLPTLQPQRSPVSSETWSCTRLSACEVTPHHKDSSISAWDMPQNMEKSDREMEQWSTCQSG